jgi:hypothetical protein
MDSERKRKASYSPRSRSPSTSSSALREPSPIRKVISFSSQARASGSGKDLLLNALRLISYRPFYDVLIKASPLCRNRRLVNHQVLAVLEANDSREEEYI